MPQPIYRLVSMFLAEVIYYGNSTGISQSDIFSNGKPISSRLDDQHYEGRQNSKKTKRNNEGF
jgi:hypothetical protein